MGFAKTGHGQSLGFIQPQESKEADKKPEPATQPKQQPPPKK